MLSKNLIGLAATLSLLGAGTVAADCSAHRCVGQIEVLYVNINKSYVNIVTVGNENRLACAPTEGRFIRLYPNQALFDQVFSLLLAAQLSGTEVNVRVNTDGSECRVLYVLSDG